LYLDYVKVGRYISDVASVASSAYSISEDQIILSTEGVPVDLFKTYIYAQNNGSFEVYEADGATVKVGAISDGDKLIATAEDGVSTKTYIVRIGEIPDFHNYINDDFDSLVGNSHGRGVEFY